MLKFKNVGKVYSRDGVETTALIDINLEIKKGEFVAIMGPSGSGKSTLMNIIGALDTPTTGDYYLEDTRVSSLDDEQLSDLRNKKIGFIFQSFNLLPRTTALKNVSLPMAYAGIPQKERVKRAYELLDLVGLADRSQHLSNQLSGGQQQRVAIARGLSMNPAILLADEPTGNIASVQADEIMNIFAKLHKKGNTIIMITHEEDIANYAKRIITIKDGKIVSDRKNNAR